MFELPPCSRLSQYEVLTMRTLCTAPFQGLMDTYLWIPEEHPEQQYISLKEKAQVTGKGLGTPRL